MLVALAREGGKEGRERVKEGRRDGGDLMGGGRVRGGRDNV